MSEKSKSPEDPIAEIERALRERDETRQRAIDLAWHQVDGAMTSDEKMHALDNVARMLGVLDEFHGQFPETFPGENNK